MAKKENERDFNKELVDKQIEAYIKLKALYDKTIDAILASIPLTSLPVDEAIKIERYNYLYKTINNEIKNLNATIYSYIRDKTREAWDLANDKATQTLIQEFEKRGLKPPTGMKGQNIADYDKFAKRKINGVNMSGRVWNISAGYKKEIEEAINAAIKEGRSAKELASDIKKYLNNPDARFRRIRDKAGELKLSTNAMQYNPGRGVYRSAFQNALRLARNEINLAFHQAEYERWAVMPFIVGYRVRNSQNRVSTVCDICKAIDSVEFPKSIHVLPVHVQCMCTAISIQCSDEEFERIANGENIIPKEISLSDAARNHIDKYMK